MSADEAPKLCVLIPAYNCADTLSEVCARIALPTQRDEIVVVDDGSSDDTLRVAAQIPRVHVERNKTNLGYGATSHRLYQIALGRGADFTINLHGDLGHRPEDVPVLLRALQESNQDIVVGSRLLTIMESARARGWSRLFSQGVLHGMPAHRALGHLGLTWFQNLCFGTNLHCFHEGMRAGTRAVAEWAVAAELPAWYSYDTELLLGASRRGFRIAEVAIEPFYDHRAKSAAPPIRYGLRTARHALGVAVRRGR